MYSSHLFQRVASFLPHDSDGVCGSVMCMFSSLSESGFIPTYVFERLGLVFDDNVRSHLFQRVASFLPRSCNQGTIQEQRSSHLFQRVASFLHVRDVLEKEDVKFLFSSLSESGFIPTRGSN